MFGRAYFALRYFAARYFGVGGSTPPVHTGVPTICPPVTPNWTQMNITSDFAVSVTGWELPATVDENLES